MKAIYYWEENAAGGVRLLRAFGRTPEVTVPDFIEGKPVTEIGAYCFAAQCRLPGDYRITRTEGMAEELRELSGDYPVKIYLPDSIEKIGNFAFYNCVSLTGLNLGNRMETLGGDAFMNCRRLHRITLRSGALEKSGMRQILSQISADMEVTFEGKCGTEAVLLFPEYYESYDEIAPAHLFGRNIEGEGFRARQCFREGIYDFSQYDTIFPKACAEEQEKTLCRMAMNRLRYPVGLSEEAKGLYENYVSRHVEYICKQAVQGRELEPVTFLCERGLLDRAGMQYCIRCATEAEWAEGTVLLLHLQENYFPEKTVRERYSFDDF